MLKFFGIGLLSYALLYIVVIHVVPKDKIEDLIPELPEIIQAFEQIIKLNEDENPNFTEDLNSAPKPITPWYGWTILAGAIFAMAYISWTYLKTT